MSEMTAEELDCPNCGRTQTVTVWESLNVTEHPELRDKLFDAEINVFTCTGCNESVVLDTPLLYHDVQRQYCVQYYPQEALDDTEFLQQFGPDGQLDVPGVPEELDEELAYILTPHIVFDLDELVRYVDFRDRVFDLVVDEDDDADA